MAIKRLPSTGDAPRATGVPESLVAGGSADSAGFPWDGRSFDHHGTAFADDDGATPPALAAAVAAVRAAAARPIRAGDAEELQRLAGAHADAVQALSGCRVLIPLLAEAGETGLTPEGRVVEKSQELSIVTVASPDGRRVMPVFSSVATMRAWNPQARPIPVPGPQAALAAAQEQTDLIIVDPGTAEREIGVRRTQLEAMATGERVLPAWADPAVLAAFRASLGRDPRISGVMLAPGDPGARLLAPEIDVILEIRPGLDRDALRELVAEVQRRWAADATIADRVDSMRLRPVAA
ncbi:SseB family protein [Leucobacter triazinivorans]|uniref:SseB family protein n=1 Tax=Leucobacter triazinivorans TaxID=1784719 RepID=A0A4P6KCK4_9MICO|nr:SseB family protein [Leucobacter triazinivorans]QBE47853.1 SseB family protein [Leucobacter triazinivorans]